MPEELPDTILTLIIAGLVLFIGIAAVSTVVSTTDVQGQTQQDAALLDGTNFVAIGSGYDIGTNQQVFDSLGNAVKLTGASDSKIQSTQDIELATDDTWTVSLWASRDETTTENMTALSVDGKLIVTYNGSQGNYTAWYYDAGSTSSYTVSVASTANPGQLENIIVTRDNDTLALYANTTAGESISVSGENTEPAPVNTTNWDGRLDETRFSDVAWNSTIRSTHYNNPIDVLGTNVTGRIMFDEPYRTDQYFFYSSARIATANVSYAQGLPGQELVASGAVLQQSDYEWQTEGPRIRGISGGEIENAPVAYARYDGGGRVGSLLDNYSNAISLAGLALVIVVLGSILSYLYALDSGR